jgi:hypothetical protein
MKGSFNDGWGEVVGAKALVFQYPPMKEAKGNRPEGHQDPPALYAQLEIQRYTDGTFTARAGDAPEEVLLKMVGPNRDSGELDLCHAGTAGSREDEPEDGGGELGAEGPTVFATRDGFAFSDACKWIQFTDSLKEKGFKPEVLKYTWLPDLIGLRAFFATVTVKWRGKPPADAQGDPTKFAVTEIKRYPYEAKPAAEAKAEPKAKAAAKGKSSAAPKPEPKAEPAPAAEEPSVDGDENSIEIAGISIFEKIAQKNTGKTLATGKIKSLAFLEMQKSGYPKESHKDIQEYIKSQVDSGEAMYWTFNDAKTEAKAD